MSGFDEDLKFFAPGYMNYQKGNTVPMLILRKLITHYSLFTTHFRNRSVVRMARPRSREGRKGTRSIYFWKDKFITT